MAQIRPSNVGDYTRRDTAHVDSAMRPTKYDYDRYIWLVQLGRRLNWNQAELLDENPFRVADPTMTFTLLRAHRDLAQIGQALGRDISDIHAEIAELEAGAATLWNEALGSYDARDAISGNWSRSVSNASFLCWYAGLESSAMQRVYKKVMDAVHYGVPSHDPGSDKFDRKRYWRGPVWGMMNMMIGTGLTDMDLAEGEALRKSTADLIAQHGFAEYFDPRDGSPAGGASFTWTAAIWLGWASPNAGQS